MSTENLELKRLHNDELRLKLEERQAKFDRRYRLLELKEKRADRDIKKREIELSQGKGIRFTTSQAAVVGAVLALLSGILGGLIQSMTTHNVESDKNAALIEIERVKSNASIELESQKQKTLERLERAKFETTLILKATEASKREDQIRNLKFFLNAGFISDPGGKISNMDEDAFPSLPIEQQSQRLTPNEVYSDSKATIGSLKVEWIDNNAVKNQVRGTAFMVSKLGYALTSASLFSTALKAHNIEIFFSLGSQSSLKIPASIISINNQKNIALIKLNSDSDNYKSVSLSPESVQVGERVYVVGFTQGQGLTFVSGLTSSLNAPAGMIRLTTQLTSEHAGSPVFNEFGEVVAIVVAKTQNNETLSVPIVFSRSMLIDIGIQ